MKINFDCFGLDHFIKLAHCNLETNKFYAAKSN